ncbi:DHH family phosphoesterase [Campylobacter fetus]|uniref:3'-to-5' oligoribonuclease B n=1 Tax=Campylobacter fetus subsp. testudinum TaxID=1507806 RepID=A0AAX0HD91_CAMFE|nr:3'-to-5' oligoribonuclease B [Campylobacter fetus]ALV65100.1 oligoribonuclease NrnB [Campylobacter fetus subsp. testudinum Sp3]AVK81371.1 3'-to-5' oligoribonuclease B [Campylobacter fetus subsp. testudinum]EAK0826361.1 3'-to-5' oligoribonuclease B [Campylobacter fetus]EAK0829600.1 3'-to-5' oligoribonuclease B [Campylobacter fetus]MPB73189.1 3'-to-5' oligoribonuclease B [Campylobacter fetus]
MKIYHLSHTDLDGYSAQLVTSFYLKNIKFYNSNYGKEIDDKFTHILSQIGDEKAIVLITDLNLTMQQCIHYENLISDKNIKLILLDHHQTGLECADKFEWYYMDSKRCATKITYDFFSSMFGADERLESYCNVVNAVDIWLKDDPNFELGKVCMGIIAGAREINKVLFEEKHMEYMFYLMNSFMEFIGQNNAHIKLDDEIHHIKKAFFKFKNDDTLSNLNSSYLVRLLSFEKDKFTIDYRGHKGVLTHNIGSTSIIGNDFLVANPDYDFFLDVTSKKTFSFRANGNLDVSLMAKELVDGGGHINASGGFFTGFKDSYNYELVKSQITQLIEKKTGVTK